MKKFNRWLQNIINKIYLEYFKWTLKKKDIIFCKGSKISSEDIFEGNNYVGQRTHVLNSYIGCGTYFMDNCWFRNARIGRFCSIASDVKMVSGKEHPVRKYVSTSPIFHLKKSLIKTYVAESCYESYKKCKGDCQYECIIGNDVWIGTRAIIMGAISIGDGAIVGAGAIVTKDIPPYAIAAGVPAKIIGYRFEDEQIQKLISIRWWDMPEEWLREHADQFADIECFLEQNYGELMAFGQRAFDKSS